MFLFLIHVILFSAIKGLLVMFYILQSLTGKDNFPANKRGEGKSNTRRFEKQRPGYVGRMNPLTKNGKATALDRAEVFKSQNPSSFHVAMKPTYLRRF